MVSYCFTVEREGFDRERSLKSEEKEARKRSERTFESLGFRLGISVDIFSFLFCFGLGRVG